MYEWQGIYDIGVRNYLSQWNRYWLKMKVEELLAAKNHNIKFLVILRQADNDKNEKATMYDKSKSRCIFNWNINITSLAMNWFN